MKGWSPFKQKETFSEKARRARMMRPIKGEYIEGQEEGSHSTHLMATYTGEGEKHYVAPTITNKTESGKYKNGKKIGTWILRYENGTKRKEIVYDKGEKVKEKKWDDKKHLVYEFNFKNNQKHGELIYWYKNGQIKSKETMESYDKKQAQKRGG